MIKSIQVESENDFIDKFRRILVKNKTKSLGFAFVMEAHTDVYLGQVLKNKQMLKSLATYQKKART